MIYNSRNLISFIAKTHKFFPDFLIYNSRNLISFIATKFLKGKRCVDIEI